MSVPRPLPARPSLEYERKEAKALLRRLRAGDPDALARARARHPALDAAAPERAQLADAQLVVAREYGFASWPKLVRWFDDVERQRHGWKRTEFHQIEAYEESVRGLLASHRSRRTYAARSLAVFVPRFYGLRADDVFALPPTEDDARLAVAREHGFPSWAALLESVAAAAARRSGGTAVDPMRFAGEAIGARDLDELQRVVAAYPELLLPPEDEAMRGRRLLASVVHHERRAGVEAMRPIRDWLESQGLDYQLELNVQLCGHMRMSTDKVCWLLERGADASWVAPNGVPVLEHALIRYWNGDAARLVAERTRPRDALWIAAGLGDVDGVRRSLDRHGRPTPDATRLRPRFDLVGPMTIFSHPDPDDEELLIEAFFVAMLNGRVAVLEHMAARGFPLDTLAWEQPMISVAAGNGWVPVVECLLRLGADPDLRGWHPQQSAREIARDWFESNPNAVNLRRVVELLGMDPDAILAERAARPVGPPTMHPMLQQAFELAGNDAFRLGQPDIRPENLLHGVLRSSRIDALPLGGVRAEHLERFGAEVGARVRAIAEQVERPTLPMRADAQAAIDWMITRVTERRGEFLTIYHLLHALTRDADGAIAELLARHGTSAAAVHAELAGYVD